MFKNCQWTARQLRVFATANDLQISPFYSDGKTYGTPVWIWSVVVSDQLFIRAWHGRQSSWYHSAVAQRAGRMHLAKCNYQVCFCPVENVQLLNTVDDEYRTKYASSAYVYGMITRKSRESTLSVTRRGDKN